MCDGGGRQRSFVLCLHQGRQQWLCRLCAVWWLGDAQQWQREGPRSWRPSLECSRTGLCWAMRYIEERQCGSRAQSGYIHTYIHGRLLSKSLCSTRWKAHVASACMWIGLNISFYVYIKVFMWLVWTKCTALPSVYVKAYYSQSHCDIKGSLSNITWHCTHSDRINIILL